MEGPVNLRFRVVCTLGAVALQQATACADSEPNMRNAPPQLTDAAVADSGSSDRQTLGDSGGARDAAADTAPEQVPNTDCEDNLNPDTLYACHGCHAPGILGPEDDFAPSEELSECIDGLQIHMPDDLPCGACEDDGFWCEVTVYSACDCDGMGDEPTFVENVPPELAFYHGWVCTCSAGEWSCWIRDQSPAACRTACNDRQE
jgi:hypothetical protein